MSYQEINYVYLLFVSRQSSYGNKRAFLLMTSGVSAPNLKHSGGVEEENFDEDLLQLKDLGGRLDKITVDSANDLPVTV